MTCVIKSPTGLECLFFEGGLISSSLSIPENSFTLSVVPYLGSEILIPGLGILVPLFGVIPEPGDLVPVFDVLIRGNIVVALHDFLGTSHEPMFVHTWGEG